ncbi:nucleolar protein of 40 kDa [Puma concolor]|uniref:Nucleolar protein of 40 kDa n=1 Tax=Puma concolor TaxID=9696 RepID=A0A6P6I3H8_PUMCO|nr:nucleolar protein of 40 kDa [Puma concolor]
MPGLVGRAGVPPRRAVSCGWKRCLGFGVSRNAAAGRPGADTETLELALPEEKWRSHRTSRMNSGRPETMENLPALYTIFQGEVAMVTDYGAFIKIPGCRKQDDQKIDTLMLVPSSFYQKGSVKSVDGNSPAPVPDRELVMKNDRIKVSLSMKVVNQGTGKDLDPNNVIIEQEERRRRSFQDYTGQKITLEAVLNTTCKKCGCKGHFAKDCFMQPGGTKYSLIPDEEEEKEEAKSAEFEKPDPTRNSSRKRKKEKKKKKHRDRKSSDSDSSDSESDTGKRARHTSKDSKAAKKKKKKKKHKKKHKE